MKRVLFALCLIVTLVMRVLFALCLIVTLLMRVLFALCLIVTLVMRALCFVFDCYVSNARSLFCV